MKRSLYNIGMKSNLVRDGYDRMAKAYLAKRDNLKSGKYVQELLKYLTKNSTVLDLGCGAGVPIDDILLKSGHSVTGIDISGEQIKLARNNCRGGEFFVGNIENLREGEYSVDVIVSFYTLFHISRDKQAAILKIIASYLVSGGWLLITMGDREFEGEHMLHGVKMWSSQFGTVKNHKMVEECSLPAGRQGFKILMDELDTSGGERHQIILAKKL